MRLRLRPFYLAFSVLLFDCATLESFPSETCGNGVVDATEDCDSFPNDVTGRCGAASEGEAACRLHCGKQPGGETLACPEGWGCSVKGVCRQPSGQFDDALTSVSAGVTNVDVGDFDGDGRKDVLGTGPRTTDNASRVRVHYFDDLGALAQAVSLPSQLVSPAVVDFDHNGRDDITFGLSGYAGPGGLGVVGGLSDRRFLSVLFPAVTIGDTEAVPISVRATTDLPLPNGATSSILLFGRSPQGAALSSLEAEVGVGGAQLKRELPVGPEAIRGRALAAPVFDLDAKSTCGEVVAAVDTAEGPRVYVFSPCTYVDGPAGRVARWEGSKARGFDQLVVPKPLGTKGIVLADVNSDGHVDLLVDTTEGAYAALNDGTKLSALFPANVGAVMPRAAADLNRDGVVDYVFDNVVAMSKPASGGADAGADGGAGGYDVVVLETSGTWSDVIVGNFNGDGYPDLVAMRAGSPDVRLYAGGASNAFTSITVTTDNVVEQIAKGDFDGDHVDDIALAQTSSVAGTSDLAIAYGRAIGGPEPSRLVGRLAQPQGLVGIPNETGAVDDLGVYTYGTKLPSGLRPTSFTLVVGSGDRQALAPLFYLDQGSTRPLKKDAAVATTDARLWVPVAVAPGAFHEADQADVFSYALGITVNARTGELRPGYVAGAWQALADPAAQGGLAPPVEVQAIDGNLQFLDPVTRAVNVATTTGDIDNAPDRLDEVIVLTNDPRGSGSVLQIVHPSKGGPSGAPLSVPDLRMAPGAQLQLVDVDGDGLRDAVGVFGPKESAQVFVLLNDGNGSFSPKGIPVSLGGAASAAKAFAAVTVGGAPAIGPGRRTRSLAVVTERSVALATLRADRSGFDVRDLSAQLGAKGLASGTGIASGDFNGDGVDDLAIADAGTIRLVLQIPARQR